MSIFNWLAIMVLSLISGVIDSKGFSFASEAWIKGNFHPNALVKSFAAFSIGLTFYWATVFFMKRVGINAAELQAGLWFTVVIIGVSLASGSFLQWNQIDKVVAFLTVAGLLFLLVRNGG